MRRKKTRKKPTRKVLITAAVSALAALVLVAAGLLLVSKWPSRQIEKPQELDHVTISRPVIVGEEILIKGCLFELGIPRDKVSIKGRSVKVSVAKVPSTAHIRKAFADLEDEEGVKVRQDEPSRLKVTMNGGTWEILFSATRVQKETRARIAIIVDDMGQDMNIARKLSAIDADITFSVLPQERYTQDVARYLHKRGRQVLLHIPMEGNGKNPGQGAIYGDTDPAQAMVILQESLELVPHAKGVNNHMGSVVTRNREIMDALFSVLKERDLFFVDSLTTNGSVCRAAAEDAALPFEVRDVFLDNEQSMDYITGQIDRLVNVALSTGEAIGICHPHQATYETLAREVPRLEGRGIEIVRVSKLVDRHY